MLPTNTQNVIKKSLVQTSFLGNKLLRGRLQNHRNIYATQATQASVSILNQPDYQLSPYVYSDTQNVGISSNHNTAIAASPAQDPRKLCPNNAPLFSLSSSLAHFFPPANTSARHCLLDATWGDARQRSESRSLHTSAQRWDNLVVDTEEDFETKVMRSRLPVVVSFHADWCEPCHELRPLLQEMVAKFPGKIHLAEVRVDDHLALVQAFEVEAVPAVLGVVGGQVTNKFVGFVSYDDVKAFVDEMVAG